MIKDRNLTRHVVLHMGDPYVIDNPCTKRMRAFKQELENRGYQVTILAPENPDIEKVEYVTYCKTIPLKKKNSIYRLLNGMGFAITSMFSVRKLGKVDVVIVTSPPPLASISGWYLAKRKKAKLIYDVRDIWPDVALEMGSFSEKSIYCRLFTFIRNFMLRHSDLVTAVSDGKVEKLNFYNPQKHVVKIPNGFDTNFLNNDINTKLVKEFQKINGFKCVYIGNLGLAQGLKQLLEVAERAQKEQMKALFLLYGSGVEEQMLKEYAKERKLENIRFEGRLPHKDIYTVLKGADVSFVSLVNSHLKDSIPTKLYEALGVGCPVLLVAEGDSVNILNETGYGISASPDVPEDIWKAFADIYGKKEYFRKYKQSAEELIRTKYSIQTSAKMMADEIEKLL